MAGRRAKSRTHGTSPWYQRVRRDGAARMEREEKQARRRERVEQPEGKRVEALSLYECAHRTLGLHLPSLPGILINWRKPW